MHGTQLARHWQLLFTIFFAAAIFSATPSMAASTFDINKATAAELEANLDGVGPKKAKAIVNYRRKNGRFKTTDDLLKVAGIGPGTVKKNLKVLNLKRGSVPLTTSTKKKKTPSKTTAAAKKKTTATLPKPKKKKATASTAKPKKKKTTTNK